MNKDAIKEMKSSAIDVSRNYEEYVRDLSHRNSSKALDLYREASRHAGEKSEKGVTGGLIVSMGALASAGSAQVLVTVGGLSAVSLATVPGVIAASAAVATVGSAALVAGGLAYIGKAAYHAIAESIAMKESGLLRDKTDDQLVEEDRLQQIKDSTGIWDKAMSLVRTGSVYGDVESQQQNERVAQRPS